MEKKGDSMEIETLNKNYYNETQQFLQSCFSCFHCNIIENPPFLLDCGHTYCKRCVSDFNMKEKNGSIICKFCYKITEKNNLLPEVELKYFITKINSINDNDFRELYSNKIKFIYSCNNKLTNKELISSLLKSESIEQKQMKKAKIKNNQKRRFKDVEKEEQNEEKHNYVINSKKVFLKYS